MLHKLSVYVREILVLLKGKGSLITSLRETTFADARCEHTAGCVHT